MFLFLIFSCAIETIQINISYFKARSKGCVLKTIFENSAGARITPSDTIDRTGDPAAEVPVLPFMSPCFPEMERDTDSHSISILIYI